MVLGFFDLERLIGDKYNARWHRTVEKNVNAMKNNFNAFNN